MELNEKEFIDLSAYSVDRRRHLFPSLVFRDTAYCILYRTVYGYNAYCTEVYPDTCDMLRALNNADYKERKAVNNLGRM